MLKDKLINKIIELYGDNAQYIIEDQRVSFEIKWVEIYENRGDNVMAEFTYKTALEKAEEKNILVIMGEFK